MKNYMSKINQLSHKDQVIIFTIFIYSILLSGCYTTKEITLDGLGQKDTENYESISNITSKDSTKIKFCYKELRNDSKYQSHFKNVNDIILLTPKSKSIINDIVSSKFERIENGQSTGDIILGATLMSVIVTSVLLLFLSISTP